MTNIVKLNWQQRLAVINDINPTDTQASKVFGVSVDEINTARKTVTADANFDTAPFKAHFSKISTTQTDDGEISTSGTVIKKKRGRSGSRVVDAFGKVTRTPVTLAAFATTHNVSTNVLRQVKRFTTDPQGVTLPQFEGKNIRVGKKDGNSSIWLETDVVEKTGTADNS